MYHIKTDKRSQTSAAEIVRGLQECLKTTPLKFITVTDIHRTTGISRATFYRLFDTPEDVLIYQLDQMNSTIADYYETAWDATSADLLEESMRVGMYYHDFIKAMVENGRFDLLYQYTEKNFRALDEKQRVFPEDMDTPERDYMIAHLSMAMVASLITWSRNGRRDTPADMLHYLRRYVRVIGGMIGGTSGKPDEKK